jgi:hypothetical protein
LIDSLINQLARLGWSVIFVDTSKYPNHTWIQQLPELISELRQKEFHRITLLHYGNRLNETLQYFLKPQAKRVNGLVLLSAYDEQILASQRIDIGFPVFDIVGQFDYDFILQQLVGRSKEFAAYRYRQITLPGAEHDFGYSQKLLLSFIHGWMSRLPETWPVDLPLSLSYIPPIKEIPVMELVVSRPAG